MLFLRTDGEIVDKVEIAHLLIGLGTAADEMRREGRRVGGISELDILVPDTDEGVIYLPPTWIQGGLEGDSISQQGVVMLQSFFNFLHSAGILSMHHTCGMFSKLPGARI